MIVTSVVPPGTDTSVPGGVWPILTVRTDEQGQTIVTRGTSSNEWPSVRAVLKYMHGRFGNASFRGEKWTPESPEDQAACIAFYEQNKERVNAYLAEVNAVSARHNLYLYPADTNEVSITVKGLAFNVKGDWIGMNRLAEVDLALDSRTENPILVSDWTW
jgi:hypothetical protein